MTPVRRRAILALALPTIGGMTSQNLMNLVDTAMVGALGPAALAGVGLASFLNFFAFAAIAGLAPAVQAIAARRYGEGKLEQTALPLNGGLLLALLLGLPLTVLLVALVPHVFPLLNHDAALVDAGAPYLQWRLLGLIAVGMNFSFRGYWNAVNRAHIYMYTLVVMHLFNAALSYVLIFGKLGLPAMGTAGAAIGTTIATWLGTAWYFFYALRHQASAGFLHGLPSRRRIIDLLRLGVPTSLQQLFFSAGFAVLFWIIGQVGTNALAISNVLVNVTLVAILPAMGFGLAAASLVSQSLGRRDAADAYRWAWDVSRIACMAFVVIGAVMLCLPDAVLGIFLHDAVLIDLGRPALQMIGVIITVDGIGLIMMQALLGAGASRPVMYISIGLQWGLFLPLVWLLGPVLGFGLTVLWVSFIVYRLLQAGLFIGLWQRRGWVHIRV